MPDEETDLLEYGYELDPAQDTFGKGAVGFPTKPGQPVDWRGITFPSREALVNWLKLVVQRFLPDEEVVLAEEQQVKTPFKAYAVLTTGRLILAKTHSDRAPELWFWNPKLLTLRAVTEAASSTLYIQAPNKQHLALSLLAPHAAQRIEDAVRLMASGRLTPPSEVPSRIAFEGVYPIEYYEAMLGPNTKREIHTLEYGRHSLVLEAVTGARRGFFLVRHLLDTPTGPQEVDERIAPFRSNRAQIIREAGPPYQIYVLPASQENPTAVLARHGITMRAGADQIRERYVQQARKSGLLAMVEALRAAGATEGHERGQYSILKGSDNDYLTFNGRVFAFDKNGDPVALKHIH